MPAGGDHRRAGRGRGEVHRLAGRGGRLQGISGLPGLDLRVAELDGGARDRTTEQALWDGTEQARPGNHLGDISSAIQRAVELEGLSIIRSLVGHGIGRDMHEDPQIPNYGEQGRGPLLEPGMVLAIEPMVNAGTHQVRIGEDNWAVYSQDGSLAAHFEFTVAVTEDGPRILTPWHED
jgi:methionyl aminopeptidase